MDDTKYWLAINSNTKIGPANFQKLFNYFGDLKKAWEADSGDLVRAGLSQKIIESFLETRQQIKPEKELEKLNKLKIKILTLKDKSYPLNLKEIHLPPPVLYIKGEILPEDEQALGVVGTRKMTIYGKRACSEIVWGLAKNKITVVSGLALGIDAVAHRTALEAGGRTIAVLGSGLDRVYPASNLQLAQKIVNENRGAVISEFPLGTISFKSNFPQRNRIISGLSLGTLVVEAAQRSGALITANFTLEQNRQVFAIPGSIFSSQSAGCNNLIKLGAKAVSSYLDILDDLNIPDKWLGQSAEEIKPETKEEMEILKILDRDEPIQIDKIIQKTGFEVSQVSSTLMLMEIKGMVKNLGSANYVRK